MAKDDVIEIEGIVVDALPNAMFTVDIGDPGEATNRTVVTFVGEPEAVCDAAVAAIKRATELIDMRQNYRFQHPQISPRYIRDVVYRESHS